MMDNKNMSPQRTPERGSASRLRGSSGYDDAVYVTGFMTSLGVIDVHRVAIAFGLAVEQLATIAGIDRVPALTDSDQNAFRVQARVAEMLEIIRRIRVGRGSEAQAMAWYRSQPIPALGGKTAEALVKEGQAHVVRDHLDHGDNRG